MKRLLKECMINAIPALLFIFGTLIIQKSTQHNDTYSIVGLIVYILGFWSLYLHTYLMNKLNEKDDS
jgi:hypothetical protein